MSFIKMRREQIIELEIKAETLKKNGKYLECMDVVEEILNIKKYSYGEANEETLKTSEKLCELCNLVSMIFLQKEKFETALDFLRKAELLCHNSIQFKSVTLNNLGCFYRRTGKLRTSLKYLEEALDLELKLENPTSIADTHLNLCAVLSQLNKHDDALEHILLAIVLLQDEFLINEMIIDVQKIEDENEVKLKEKEIFFKKNNKNLEDRAAVLTIAYHNMGVELEFLKRFEESIKTYEKGLRFSSKYLGKDHHLVSNLKQVLNTAKKEISNQREKEIKKKEEKDLIVANKNLSRKKPPTAFSDAFKRKSMQSSQYFNSGDNENLQDHAKNVKKKEVTSKGLKNLINNQKVAAYRPLNNPYSTDKEEAKTQIIEEKNSNSGAENQDSQGLIRAISKHSDIQEVSALVKE